MEFDITSKHPDYTKWLPTWQKMRDTSSGEMAVKQEGEKYLPMKSGIAAIKDMSRRQKAYDAYRFRAEFPEIVAPTIRGSVGMIHSKESTIELPNVLEPLRARATQDGLTLNQLHRRVTSEILRMGRFGLIPGVDENGDFFFARYSTEAIINWDEVDGETAYLVLDESSDIRDPATNKWEKLEQYRECLVDEGVFRTRVWRKGGDGELKVVEEDDGATIRGRERLDFLPFTFIGSQDMTPAPDEVPLQGLANLALRAYLLDADYTTTLHMTSEPTPWISGVDEKNAPKTIGASKVWVLEPDTAKAGMLEFSGPGVGAQEKAIAETLRRAVMFGAQLFGDTSKSQESGAAKKTRLAHETSTLRLIATSSAAGLEAALKNAAIWAGASENEVDSITVEPNLDFVDHELSPQEITALVAGWMQGAYSKLTLFENLRRGSIIDEKREFEEEEQLILDNIDMPASEQDREQAGELDLEDDEDNGVNSLTTAIQGLQAALA